MWGNPMREIEILLFSFSKVHINNNNTILIQEKSHLQHPKLFQKFMPQFVCQVCIVVQPTQKKQHLKNRAKQLLN